MKHCVFVIALLGGVFLTACGSGDEASDAGTEQTSLKDLDISYEDLIERIDHLDAELQATTELDEMLKLANEQARMCEAFQLKFPTDPRAAEILLQGGHAARTAKKYTKAVALYYDVAQQYKTYEKRPEAMFLRAFVLDEDMNRKEQAREAYNELIAAYPRHRLSQDAQHLLTQLYMSDEDILKMLEEKNSPVDTAA